MSHVLFSTLCLMTLACGGGSGSPTSPLPFGTGFADGEWRVGVDIAPGRYFADPPGYPCIWSRRRGTNNTPEEFITGESLHFDTLQWVVDILPSDAAFYSSGCGSFSLVPRFSPPLPEQIWPGAYLVGSQVPPGTYRTASVIGCRWARVRSFTGESAVDTIQGGFVSPFSITPPPSELIVTIDPSDVGFKTHKECGTWQRVA